MAEPKSKRLALLLLGGKKPGGEEKGAEPVGDARSSACEGILDALKENDAAALDEALSAWMNAHEADRANG